MRGDRAKKSRRESVALPSCTSLFPNIPQVYRVTFLFLLSTCRHCTRSRITHTIARPLVSSLSPSVAAHRCRGANRSHRALGTRSISVPRLPARHNYFAKRTDSRLYPRLSRGDRTKSVRLCGTSAEEIFLTARCHRVRPTEITDEDSERSSTSVTVQERAGGGLLLCE